MANPSDPARGAGTIRSAQPSLRDRFDALGNLPPFLRQIWATSPTLTLTTLGLRLVRAFLPIATLYVGKLIIDEAVRLVGAGTSFESLGAYRTGEANLGTRDRPRRVRAASVSGGFFDALGVPPLLGRTIRSEDTLPGAAPIAVLSYDLWQSVFSSEPALVGSLIEVDGEKIEVVGVMPQEFDLATEPEVRCERPAPASGGLAVADVVAGPVLGDRGQVVPSGRRPQLSDVDHAAASPSIAPSAVWSVRSGASR